MKDEGVELIKERHLRWIARARNTSGYFIFYRDFGSFLSKTEALFVQDLMNRREMAFRRAEENRKFKKKKSPVDDEGFFQCTTGYMENPKYLVWTRREQERMFKSLAKKGLVKLKRKGIPPNRWVWMDIEKIETLLDEVEDGRKS